MTSVFLWFFLLQVTEIVCAGIVAIRVHLSVEATDAPEYEWGRLFLKAVGALCFAGGLLAFFWLFTIFGDEIIPTVRDTPGYRWWLLLFLFLARLPYFRALWILWRLMDSAEDGLTR